MAALRRADDTAGFRAILDAGADRVRALRAFPGLTVATINGVAAGAGLALALHCDLRLAVPGARLAASWGGIGLAPDWGATHLLPLLLGRARALRMVLARETLDSAEALELGLIQEIVVPERLRERARQMADEFGRPAETVRRVKELLRSGLDDALETSLAAETEHQAALFTSSAVADGLAAFEARRERRAAPAGDS